MNNYSDIHKIAKNYSKSLFELVVQEKALENVYKDFTDFYNVYLESEELRKFLDNCLINPDLKQKVVKDILKKITTDQYLSNFILLLVSSKRIAQLKEIYNSFQVLYYKQNGVMEVELVSAHEISKAMEQKIVDFLTSKYNKVIKLNKSINHAMLGGFTLQIGADLYDASLRNNINSLKESSKKIINNYLN